MTTLTYIDEEKSTQEWMNTTNTLVDFYNTSQNSQTNAAYLHANSAYLKANAVNIELNASYIHVNSSYLFANSINVELNAAYRHVNSAHLHANSAYLFANSVNLELNAAYLHANAAYNAANTISINTYSTSSNATYGSNTTSTKAANDTAPTATVGSNIVGCIVTTTGSSDRVLVSFDGIFGDDGDSNLLVLVRGSTVLKSFIVPKNGAISSVFFHYIDTPGSAAAHTYHVRWTRYTDGAGTTIYMNGYVVRKLGGTLESRISAVVIK